VRGDEWARRGRKGGARGENREHAGWKKINGKELYTPPGGCETSYNSPIDTDTGSASSAGRGRRLAAQGSGPGGRAASFTVVKSDPSHDDS